MLRAGRRSESRPTAPACLRATSDLHLEHKLKKTRREVLEIQRGRCSRARLTPDVEFSAEDATRANRYLCEVLKWGRFRATTPTPDTGLHDPPEFAHLLRHVRERVVRDSACARPLSHRSGLAVANTLAV